MEKVRWGVLGVAKIATEKVIPAMQQGKLSEVTAIASRDESKAKTAANELGIPKSYGSYEAMLADPEIDAVYNPLPNHLHVPWSIKALEAGKHVLCEKPIALTAEEVDALIAARDKTGLMVEEAFMVRHHPQWIKVKEVVQSGEIGKVQAMQCFFSYFNMDPDNVRNMADIGGGGLLDIGCYPINLSRFVFSKEPRRVNALVEFDPNFKTDRLASAMLDFGEGVHTTFTCSTQLSLYQRFVFVGDKGRLEVEIPINALPGQAMRLMIDPGADLTGTGRKMLEVASCDQYTLQGDDFSALIQGRGNNPTTLEDARKNMQVIDAIFRSGKSGQWEQP